MTPTAEELEELLRELGDVEVQTDLLRPRYNIPPSQPIPVVREVEGHRRLEELRWGLAGARGRPVQLVRVESVERGAMRGRGRALVVVSGFYEWHGREQPFEAHRPGGGLFALAAVWDGDACAILTQPSRAGLAAIHDRMPLVVPPERFGEWLGAGPTPEIAAGVRGSQGLADGLEVRPVSTWVNNPRHDDPRCLEEPGPRLFP